jgi:hypothetical protein
LFQIYFTVVTFHTITRRRGHVEDGSRGGCPRKCAGACLTLQIYHGRSVNARLTLIGQAQRSIECIGRAGGPPHRQPCLQGAELDINLERKSSFTQLDTTRGVFYYKANSLKILLLSLTTCVRFQNLSQRDPHTSLDDLSCAHSKMPIYHALDSCAIAVS